MMSACKDGAIEFEQQKAHAKDVLKHFEHLPHEDQTFILGYLSALEPARKRKQDIPPNAKKGT